MEDLASHFIGTDGVEACVFSSAAAREAACAFIQTEIASSEAVTRLWKRRLNALAIISRLPPEILGLIFKYVTADVVKDVKLRWISQVSHVCWHWRRVALGCPDLWCFIPFTKPSWAAEMIQRSKMAPLTVAVEFSDHRGVSREKAEVIRPVLIEALKQLSRVKALSLSQTFSCDHDKFSEFIGLLDAPAPLLENLHIYFSNSSGGCLPDSLVTGSPRLLHLKLSKCGISWQGLTFSHLKSLRINNTPDTMRPPVDQFIAAISRMPVLEILEFCSSFSSTDDVHIPSQNIANLSRLRFLHIECGLTDCVFVFDHLSYPKNTRIHLKCMSPPPKLHEASNVAVALIQKLAQKLMSGIDGHIRSLAVEWYHVRCWRSNKVRMDNPQFAPTIDITIDVAPYISTVAEFMKCLSLDQLSSLMVAGSILRKEMWFKFGTLNQLETLRVESDLDVATLFDALSHGLISEEAAGVPEQPAPITQPTFRSLLKLTIIGWTFDEVLNRPHLESLMEALMNCLARRDEAGLTLHCLELQDCRHIHSEAVHELEDIVQTVEWDGEGEFTDMSDEDEYSVTYSDLEVY